MLKSQTAAYIRRLSATTFTETCLIERESQTLGTYGEPVHGWEVVAADAACRLIQAGQFNTPAGETPGQQETLPDLYRLVVARTVALDVNHRVTVNGVVYSVVRLETELTDEAFHTALISRQRGAQ